MEKRRPREDYISDEVYSLVGLELPYGRTGYNEPSMLLRYYQYYVRDTVRMKLFGDLHFDSQLIIN